MQVKQVEGPEASTRELVVDFLAAIAGERARLESDIAAAGQRERRARRALALHDVMATMLHVTEREISALLGRDDAPVLAWQCPVSPAPRMNGADSLLDHTLTAGAVVPDEHWCEIVARADLELSALERRAAEARGAAADAEDEARALGVDAEALAWVMERLRGFLDDLRDDAALDARLAVELATPAPDHNDDVLLADVWHEPFWVDDEPAAPVTGRRVRLPWRATRRR